MLPSLPFAHHISYLSITLRNVASVQCAGVLKFFEKISPPIYTIHGHLNHSIGQVYDLPILMVLMIHE